MPLYRYDLLVIVALGLQALFLALKLETWEEARVIALFHLTGTAMEFFKVHAGSWSYPEPGFFKILGVPLFSGFMYASVGSFMARTIRVFDMRFAPYPPFWTTMLLAVAIYVNFFSHHFLPDIRIALFAATILLFARTRIWYRIGDNLYWMPLPVAAFLSSIFLWLAENIGTMTGTWVYSGQARLELVSLSKMGSWYLLLYVSFVTVTLVVRGPVIGQAAGQGRACHFTNASTASPRTSRLNTKTASQVSIACRRASARSMVFRWAVILSNACSVRTASTSRASFG